MRPLLLHFLALIILGVSSAFTTAWAAECTVEPVRYAYSATPINCRGVSNLYRVTAVLYRSAQPTAEGVRAASRYLNVRTIINLQDDFKDEQLGIAPSRSLRLVQIPISSFDIPADHGRNLIEAVEAVEKYIRYGPVLVHCSRGADRTGAVIALFRMRNQRWKTDTAIREMESGPYNYNHFYSLVPPGMGNVPAFLRTDTAFQKI